MKIRSRRLLTISLFAIAALTGVRADARIVASDMTGSMSENLISFSNASSGAFSSPGDGFQKYQRAVSATIPFSVLDDSLVTFPADTLGIIDDNNLDVLFGVTDTENPDNSGAVSASWVFNVAGADDLAVSIDMGAMGDFETGDSFTWTYSIDGGPTMTAFDGVVDDTIDNNYTLAGGAVILLNDPMTVQGAVLNNTLQTFGALIAGTGSELTLTLTAVTDGGSEAFAFQNIEISAGGLPLQILAFDLVDSADQNLTDFSNPFDGAFASPGDGFQKYQRFVSSSIPFSILDDSLISFPADTLGIVDDNNTEAFFGATDTVNADTSGPVSATWTFDISGGENLGLLIDMGAMGDFESSDSFSWTYSIDGGGALTAFESSVDEATSNTHTLAGGATSTLNDPMTMQGSVLTNVLTRFSTALTGAGNELILTLTANTNGGSEAFAFQNIIVVEDFQPDEPPPPRMAEIFEIQGAGLTSPFVGRSVLSQGNVVTALAPDGFFMQTPTSRSDNDADTSDGVFVFTNTPPDVTVGDLVDVRGDVIEFFNFTEIADPTVTVTGAGFELPLPVAFDDMTPSPDPGNPSCAIEYECYESMLVEIASGAVTASNQRFNSDPIAEVHITAAPDRTFREPGLEFPGVAGLPVWDGNPEVFELDPNKLGLPNRTIAAGSSFSATGVIGFEFGGYEMWPTALEVEEAVLPTPVRHRRHYFETTVGSLNLFRLFDDVDDPPLLNAFGETTDDFVVSADEYQRRLNKLAQYIVDTMRTPDIIGVQEVEKLGVLEDLAAEIRRLRPWAKYKVYLQEGNDIGSIDVGFLVRKHRVWVRSVEQLGLEETYVDPSSGELDLLHDRPPLLLNAWAPGFFPLKVMVVHNRSLGGIATERVQRKRFEQAQSIARKVQEIQDSRRRTGLVVIGDFNAFEFSDGFVDSVGHIRGNFDPADALLSGADLVDPDLVNPLQSLPAEERYSFIFRGNAQTLDHALSNQILGRRVRDLQFARGNADAAVDLINDETTSLRASDHDGLVLYLYTGWLFRHHR